MANYELKITHLCVGLGLSVLIELNYSYTEESGRFVGLLDCGSITGGPAFYDPALDKIMNAVFLNGGMLDYVHISHFDEDHYNKLKELGRKYQKNYGDKICIPSIYFGCAANKNVRKIKEMLQKYFDIGKEDLMILEDYCLYRSGSAYKAHHEMSPRFHDCSIYLGNQYYFNISMLLYHAHLLPERYPALGDINLEDKGVLINTGSSVLLVSITKEERERVIPKVSYIFTGDATLETMKIMKRLTDLHFGGEFKLLGIAHHGAKRHVADHEATNDFSTLSWFLNLINPSAAVVSAKCKNQKGWTHPHFDTMAVYHNALPSVRGPAQMLTSFVWDSDAKQMKVKQNTINKQLYETFRLKFGEGHVEDGELYSNCKSSEYEKIDVIAYTNSMNADILSVSEIRR